MEDNTRLAKRHLRVIHACEKGATGVYWGHRLMAALFYRDIIPQLSEMQAQEVERFALFGALMRKRDARQLVLPGMLWCTGGIVYAVLTALGGRQAVWKSKAIVEGVVERKLLHASEFFKDRDHEVRDAIHIFQLNAMQAQESESR